jgi:hypothetical protein
MSEGAIEPTAVYSPGTGPAQTGRQRIYETYNTRDVPLGGDETISAPRPSTGGRAYGMFSRLPGGAAPVAVPKGVPRFLGSRPIILFAWGLAMVMVSLDEWHTHHVLPRPARLWYTSLTYFLLAAAASFDPLVPLATAMAIGLTIAVGYQYYTGAGSFGNYGAQEASTPGFNAQGQALK